MADSSAVKFLPVEKALARESSSPAMAEFTFDRFLCEQLIWRRGGHLWQDEAARLATLLEGSRRSGFGAAVLTVSDASLIDALRQQADGLGLICGPEKVLTAAGEHYLADVQKIARQADAVFLQGSLRDSEGLQCLKLACDAVHAAGKKAIWVDRSSTPLSPEKIAELPFDGLWLTDRYDFSTEEAIRRYGERFCLFGRTDFARLEEMSPMELIRDASRLWELCGGKGYVFGTGDIDGRPLPYLTFISMITAVNRLK